MAGTPSKDAGNDGNLSVQNDKETEQHNKRNANTQKQIYWLRTSATCLRNNYRIELDTKLIRDQ